MLGRLEDPALPGIAPLQNLEHRLHVGVVRSLVVAEVVVTPPRGPGHPLERVAREVRHLQFDLLVHVVRLHRVHHGNERRRGLHGRPHAVTAGPTRIGPVELGGVFRVRDRLVGLPEGHRTETRVGRQQIDEVSGARTRQPDHNDRSGDRDLEDLGMANQQVVDEEAVGSGAHAVAEHHQPPDAGALFISVHLLQLEPEAHGEVLVAEVDQASARPRGVAHGVDREHGGLGLPVVDRHALDVVEHGGGQVIDRDHVAQCGSFNWRGSRRRRPACSR